MLRSIALLVVSDGLEDFESFTSHFESVIDDSISQAGVILANLNVVMAPGVVVVDHSVDVTVVNVVEDHVPNVVGSILQVLVGNSPDISVEELVESRSDLIGFWSHPVTEALVTEDMSSSVMVPSLDHGVKNS